VRLWRLSNARHARSFDGGFGLISSGRWNSVGRPVTYCSTVPSLCALEKRVHYGSLDLLPPQQMVEYVAPDDLQIGEIGLRELPPNWHGRDLYTRRLGDAWLDGRGGALLRVPSVIVQLPSADDRNVMINHRHPDVGRIEIVDVTPFDLDTRLFAT
jgi:RES domain-containing protein